jgi:hypothetical protein
LLGRQVGNDGPIRERDGRNICRQSGDDILRLERARVPQVQDPVDPARHGVEGEELILLVVAR